ncbi:hypothetical protein ACOSQ2_028767 [Xanthoceras sorbifolium]
MNDKKNKRVVKEFVTEHSHNLINAKHTQFLHSHRTVKKSDMSIVMDHMVDQAGGYASVGHMIKDLHNIIDAKRKTLFTNSDSKSDTDVFYDYQLNEDDTLGSLFWTDSMPCNDYRRQLFIFVGVNHHNKTTTYSWILKTFLSAMHGKYPTSVVTNGDKTMLKEIKAEISGSVHRLCSWHLQRNAQANLGDTVRAAWKCMVTKMYAKRKQWAEKFLKDLFFGGIHSTQRSESINAYLNRFLNCRLKLYEYMRQIDRAMERLRHTEMKDDFENLNEHHILVTHLELLEKHATELYTRGIFQLVHDKIEEKAKLSICKFVDGVESQTYTFRKFDGGNKTWNVSYNPMLSMLQCSCKLFEAAGIPYRHTLGVMKAQNMRRIPRTLLMTRWIINAKKVTDEFMYDYRLGSLSARCSKMCYFASLTTDGHQKAKLAIDYLYRNAVTNTIFKYRNGRISKPHNCRRCRQLGHTVKTCQVDIQKGASAVGSNEGKQTSELNPLWVFQQIH